ncbi:hypothetical protein BH23GEM3_BH23GEM3_26300 [soil metagenome]|nr:hypothetical protein [Gemmatimonadota bacterium]
MRYALLGTLLFCTLFAALPAQAQQITSPYRFIEESHSIGAYGGYLLTSPGTPEVGPQSAPIFGVRYNLRFTGPLSGEAAISFSPTRRQIITSDTLILQPEPTGETAEMALLIAEAGLRLHLTGPRAWNGFAPFVVATGGLAADLTGRGAAEEEQVPAEAQRFRYGPGLAVGAGVGTDLFLSQRLSLRFEVRDHILRISIPAGLREDLRAENQWTNNIGISLGTALHF